MSGTTQNMCNKDCIKYLLLCKAGSIFLFSKRLNSLMTNGQNIEIVVALRTKCGLSSLFTLSSYTRTFIYNIKQLKIILDMILE